MQQFLPSLGIGVDPGFVNLGASIVKSTPEPFKFEVIQVYHDNPSNSKLTSYVRSTVEHMLAVCKAYGNPEISISLERFVSYGSVRSTHTEEVTRIIGMFEAFFAQNRPDIELNLLRATDWKTTLVKTLAKYTNFNNPSKSGALDKTFSMAAAKALVVNPEVIKNDHIADSICLACYPSLVEQAFNQRTVLDRRPTGSDGTGA